MDYAVRPVFFVVFAHARNFVEVLMLSTLYDLSEETVSPAWQALIIDVTPRGSKDRVHGVFGFVKALTESIFP